MKYLAFFAFFFISVSLSGCSYQYIAQSTDQVARAAEFKAHYQLERFRDIAVLPDNTICLAPVKTDDIEFVRTLEQELFAAVQQRFARVNALTNVENANGAINAAWQQGCDLLIYPTVIGREDNIWSVSEWGEPQTEWGDIGIDRLQLGFALWDVNSKQLLDKAVVRSRAAWLDLYSSDSMDLIGDSIDLYLQQLVGQR